MNDQLPKSKPMTLQDTHNATSSQGLEGAAWIDCKDGKQRLVEPSIQLLAYGISERMGLLRAAGNAIVPQVAAAFIKESLNQ